MTVSPMARCDCPVKLGGLCVLAGSNSLPGFEAMRETCEPQSRQRGVHPQAKQSTTQHTDTHTMRCRCAAAQPPGGGERCAPGR